MIAGRKRPLLWLAVAAMLCAGSASADVSPADRAAARALFDQARKLVTEGKHAEACPKFEESQRLDPGIGTLFNLADCMENTGRTASAWSMFLEAASQAKVGGQKDREKVARTRAASLEPKLSKLTITVAAGTQIPGLEIKRDGSAVREALWGTPMAIDPGDHVVVATAPGKKKFTTTVKVGGPAATETVTIPALEDAGAAPVVVPPVTTAPPAVTQTPPPAATAEPVKTSPAATATSQPAPTSKEPAQPAPDHGTPGGTQRTLGLVSGGLGVVALGVGGFLTLGARGKLNDAEEWCSGNQCTDQRGVDLHSDAVKQANLATIVGGVGGVLLVGGAVLYFTAPSKRAPNSAAARTPVVGLGPTGVVIKGAW